MRKIFYDPMLFFKAELRNKKQSKFLSRLPTSIPAP